MTTLARGISATSTILDVSDESLNVARPFLATLDSETVRVRGLEYVSGVATRWNVDRGIDSTPATHAGGATVTLGDVAGPGGAGALSLDNTIDPPSDITSLVAVGATVVGSEATLRGKDFYAQDTDPGAVGLGSVWKDTTTGVFWERNGGDDGWDPRFSPIATGAIDVAVDLQQLATASGTGTAFAGAAATTEDGNADTSSVATTTGIGAANASPRALATSGTAEAWPEATTTSGNATAGPRATATLGAADGRPRATTTSGGADASPTATTEDGTAAARLEATATGTGSATVAAAATVTTGAATAGSMAVRGAVSVGMTAAIADDGDIQFGFNGASLPIPVIPATPDAQDIADVLVALGLATQTP